MPTRTSTQAAAPGLHVAIIMDGNGRWATARGLQRPHGHQASLEAVRRTVEAAPALGVRVLTLYAFSSDNWQRPRGEVRALMALFQAHLSAEAERCRKHGIRLRVIGRRDRLPPRLRHAITAAEARTASGRTMLLRVAVDYSARDVILRAAALPGATASREAFARALGQACHDDAPVPDVDLLIRTGGEQRLSDFLLWENAYAELYFTDRLWPDFACADLEAALCTFRTRERRFGRVLEAGPNALTLPTPPLPLPETQPSCSP